MDHKLLDKYFDDQCSPKELERVLDWFQTDEGQRYLKEDFERENRYLEEKPASKKSATKIDSEKVFTRIQHHKKQEIKLKPQQKGTHGRWHIARVASIVLIAAVFSFGLYLGGVIGPEKHKPTYRKYVTAANQQKVFKLSNGVKIWLNEKSVLKVPTHFTRYRNVTLKGEAYFEVTHNVEHPFVVEANGAIIKDLGTKFNIETDSSAGTIQVAVMEGKVKLKKEGKIYQTSVTLTHNHFGILDLSSGSITIEKGNAENYLSWRTNQLVFQGAPLGQISRQLQRLYNVDISFQAEKLKKIQLTANYEKTKLKTVLTLIANTLDIHFKIDGRRVVWIK